MKRQGGWEPAGRPRQELAADPEKQSSVEDQVGLLPPAAPDVRDGSEFGTPLGSRSSPLLCAGLGSLREGGASCPALGTDAGFL